MFERAINNDKITGIAGDVIEQSLLGCRPDNSQRPDLLVDGVPTELKTTGIRRRGARWEAKEPMSVTAVSFDSLVREEFDESNFWHKLEHLLLVYYHYDSDERVAARDYAEFVITGYEFHVFSKEDVRVLRRDWTIIRDFIRMLRKSPNPDYSRLSHELRDRLMYTDTAPKYPNPPRFRLKRSFMSSIVNEYFQKIEGSRKDGEMVVEPGVDAPMKADTSIESYGELDSICRSLTSEHHGRTMASLAAEFGIKDVNKSAAEMITVRMFGMNGGKISRIPIFAKSGLNAKTVILTSKGGSTESMKLFPVDFDELQDPDRAFEDSHFFDYFVNHQFLCILFQEADGSKEMRDARFLGFKRLTVPYTFIDSEVKRTWTDLRELVLSGNLRQSVVKDRDGRPIVNKNGMTRTEVNLPKSRDHEVFLRGSGADSSDKVVILGVEMLRQHAWIKGKAIVEMLDKTGYLRLPASFSGIPRHCAHTSYTR